MDNQTLPIFADSPANWRGPQLAAQPERWQYCLSAEALAALDEAVYRLDASARDIIDMGRADAPLPVLAPLLADIGHELMHGIGFALIRGLPVHRYSLRQAAIAFWCLGRHIGAPVSQNAAGHALGHVKDLGFDYDKPTARGYQTHERLPYHCDSGDVVGLLSLRTARSGGLSSIVSSTALYNAIVERRPDLARVLTQPTFRDRRDEIPAGREPWYEMPVFNIHRCRVFAHYVRSAIRKAQRFDAVPRITPQQEAAFDYLDALAGDAEFRLDMDFEPGDVQFVCNHTILHSRTRFDDWPEPARRRHLLRLWLACDNGPPLPAVYERAQGFNGQDRPLGIHCPGVALNVPLEAEDGGAGDSASRL